MLVFDGPFVGDIAHEAARSDLVGDAWDRAEAVRGGEDLDSDGWSDLVVAGYEAAYTAGRIGVVSDPPGGSHRVWDVADATIDGDTVGGKLGLGLALGDLNEDGHVDIFGGAPFDGNGRGFVMEGPVSGATSVSSASVTVEGATPGEWTGYSGAFGDFDGDGHQDLAVGQSRSIYTGADPGEVLIFLGPLCGTYSDPDADYVVTSGSASPDGFVSIWSRGTSTVTGGWTC